MHSGALQAGKWDKDARAKHLADELRVALAKVPKDMLGKCVLMTPVHAVGGVKSRVRKTAALARRLLVAADDFVVGGYNAFQKGEGRSFAQERVAVTKKFLIETARASRSIAMQMPTWVRNVRTKPEDTIPEVIGATLGFLIGSGGLDANGGLPDLDLMAGIGNHRSVLTHSILMGAAAEAALIALDEVVLLTFEHLPMDHDPLWDTLHGQFKRTTKMARVGVGLGIAYHLGVDGSIQVAAYKDLPVSMPMEAHQALFEINAGVEAIHVASKNNED